jgi:hypothetical protein
MHDDKSGLGLRILYFLLLARKRTPHVWKREAMTEGRKLYEWSELYISVHISFGACTRVSMGKMFKHSNN